MAKLKGCLGHHCIPMLGTRQGLHDYFLNTWLLFKEIKESGESGHQGRPRRGRGITRGTFKTRAGFMWKRKQVSQSVPDLSLESHFYDVCKCWDSALWWIPEFLFSNALALRNSKTLDPGSTKWPLKSRAVDAPPLCFSPETGSGSGFYRIWLFVWRVVYSE